MFTTNHAVGYITHRAIVRSADASTGICQVEIPELTGSGVLTYVSNIGLSLIAGQYNVPAIGSTVFVASNRVSDRAFFVSEPLNASQFLPTSASTGFLPTSASSTFLPTSASSTFLPTSASSTFLPTSASSTFLPTSASSTFLPSSASISLALPQALDTSASPSFARVTSTVASGTSPFQVASNTMVTNLNANYLGGNASSAFLLTSASTGFLPTSASTGFLPTSASSTFLPTSASSGFLPVGASHSITLGGDLSGSVTVSNSASGSYTLNASIGLNSVALGTDTTGDYVAAITGAASGITVTGSGGEGASVSLALPQALHTAASPTFSQVISTASGTTPPFQVASNTMVTNLNANYLGGNASSAFLLTSASHSITLGGDLSGTVTLNNLASGSYTLNASVNADSVTLGTDTTGNYVGSVTTNEVNGISISGSGVENAAVTLTLPQSLNASATPTFSRVITTASGTTPPFQVTSTAMVNNLNANFLGGSTGSDFVAASAYTDALVLAKIKNVDGSGSGLDADLLDGLNSSDFLSSSSYTAADILAKIKTVDGTGSGLDADLLDGNDTSYFASQAGLEAVLGDLLYVGLYNPTNYAVTNRSLSASVATITTSTPHGYSVGNVVGVRLGKTTVTNMVRTGTSTTLTTEVAHGLIVGQKVFVDGVSNTVLNGTWVVTGITTVSPFTVTFNTSSSGAISSTATVGYVAPAAFWGQAYTITGASSTAFTYAFADPNIVTAAIAGTTFRMPVPVWSGAAGASAAASTTYRHGMYWIVASPTGTAVADFIDSDLSGKTDWNDVQASLLNGDWVVAINPANNPATPQVDLALSAITFQSITFSAETFIDSKIVRHMDNTNDPHGPAGYLYRGAGVTYTPFGISTVARNGTTATIVTTAPHGFTIGTKVLISNVGNSFDGIVSLNGASTSTFTFLSSAASFATTAASAGTVGAIDDRRVADQVFSRLEHNHATDIQTAIDIHAAATNPHPIYVTEDEGKILYAGKEHNHDSLYEVKDAVAGHLSAFDHSKFLTTTQSSDLYFPKTGTFDDRYYLKPVVDQKIASIVGQVFATDGGQSSRIFMGSTQPASAGLIRGDLWIETPNLDLQAPVAPSDFTTSVTSSSVTLNWKGWPASTLVTSINLLRATNELFTGASTLTVSSSATTYTDTGLLERTPYYYRLSATNASGTSPTLDTPATTTLNAAPPPPQTPVAVTVASTTNLSLSWTAASGAFADPATNRYIVSLGGASVAAVASSPYVFTGLAESTSYTTGVQTIDDLGLTSSLISAAPVTTNNIAPPAPSGASAVVLSSNQIQLTWNSVAVADFSTYRAYVYLTSLPPPAVTATQLGFAQTIDSTSTSCVFNPSPTALSYNTSYTLRVYTVDKVGNISASAAGATATTGPAPDVVPPPQATITSFKPDSSYGRMVIAGVTPATDFASYTVQRSTDGTTWTDDGTTNVAVAVNTPFSRPINSGTAYGPGTVYARVNTKDAAGNVTVGATQSYTLVASPINIVADSTNSWRNTNGGEYNQPANFRPYQGYFSISSYNAMGFWYYGTNPYSNLYNGGRRTVTGGTFLLIRADAGNSAAMTPVLAMHDYLSNPGTVTGQGTPTLYYTGQSASVSVTTPAGGSNLASATLPLQWVQDLANGTHRGIAVYAPTTPVYANFYSVAENAYSGLLSISHYG